MSRLTYANGKKKRQTLGYRRYLRRVRTILALQKHRRLIHAVNRSRVDAAYIESPKVALILQFFNKRRNIPLLAAAFKASGAEETIVIDDGSSDDSLEDWVRVQRRPNDFILRANDIFEIRTYDRAIRMSNAELVVLLQDDDIPPRDAGWVRDAEALFDQIPDLAVLGGRTAMRLLPVTGPANAVGDRPPKRHVDSQEPSHQEPKTGIPFSYVVAVNRGPMVLRRSAVLELGGINQRFAPFQNDDVDLCLRAWLGGFKVGFYEAPFDRDFRTGGMRLFNKERTAVQSAKNWPLAYDLYGDDIADGVFDRLVDEANGQLVAR